MRRGGPGGAGERKITVFFQGRRDEKTHGHEEGRGRLRKKGRVSEKKKGGKG